MSIDEKNPYEPPESEIDQPSLIIDIVSHRKQLIPKWIKAFGWLFIIFGALVPIIFAYSVATGMGGTFSLFGLGTTGSALSPAALFINFLYVALGISAYGLLFGKDWGLTACLITGYLGLAIAIFTTLSGFTTGAISIRLEPLIQIPYLIKLHKIRKSWYLQ